MSDERRERTVSKHSVFNCYRFSGPTVEPDVITLAKGLGYGVPIGAFLAKEGCMALEPGDHGSTFGGNALTTAAAYAGTKYLIDHDIPAHVKRMELYLLQHLHALRAQFPCVAAVRRKC